MLWPAHVFQAGGSSATYSWLWKFGERTKYSWYLLYQMMLIITCCSLCNQYLMLRTLRQSKHNVMICNKCGANLCISSWRILPNCPHNVLVKSVVRDTYWHIGEFSHWYFGNSRPKVQDRCFRLISMLLKKYSELHLESDDHLETWKITTVGESHDDP